MWSELLLSTALGHEWISFGTLVNVLISFVTFIRMSRCGRTRRGRYSDFGLRPDPFDILDSNSFVLYCCSCLISLISLWVWVLDCVGCARNKLVLCFSKTLLSRILLPHSSVSPCAQGVFMNSQYFCRSAKLLRVCILCSSETPCTWTVFVNSQYFYKSTKLQRVCILRSSGLALERYSLCSSSGSLSVKQLGVCILHSSINFLRSSSHIVCVLRSSITSCAQADCAHINS